jgi:hypothetical protein
MKMNGHICTCRGMLLTQSSGLLGSSEKETAPIA